MVFNKNEFRFISTALIIIIVATFVNLNISYRKSRDMQRKSDIRSIYDAMMAFEAEYGYYPSSSNGKIVACPHEGEAFTYDEEGVPILEECNYLADKFVDPVKNKTYLNPIPTDPQHEEGANYYFISDGENFEIFASLESHKEDEYNAGVEARNLPCGNRICNFSRTN